MLYNEYGTTGIQVSRIGFGGMRFPDQEDREACAQLVRTAYDQGITYFDTAIGYGKSEELFGLAFREMRKTRAERPFYVSTKTFQSDESLIRKELETSLTRLQLDCIDFYHIWCVMNLNAYEERKQHGILKTFQKLKEEGLIRNICISTHMTGPDVARLMDDYPFAGVLLGYSAMNFKFRDAGLAAAARKGAGVVVMNPLGGGIIPRFPDRFSFVKTRADETVVQGALRFLLNDSRITVSLVGFSNAAQVAEAVAAVDGFQPLASRFARGSAAPSTNCAPAANIAWIVRRKYRFPSSWMPTTIICWKGRMMRCSTGCAGTGASPRKTCCSLPAASAVTARAPARRSFPSSRGSRPCARKPRQGLPGSRSARLWAGRHCSLSRLKAKVAIPPPGWVLAPPGYGLTRFVWQGYRQINLLILPGNNRSGLYPSSVNRCQSNSSIFCLWA